MSSCECRLCGNFSPPKMKMSDKIKGFLSFKEFIEYFCRIELDDDDDPKLPTAVCHECYSVLLNFCMFTVNAEKQQNKFKNRLPQSPVVRESTKRKNEEESVGQKNEQFSPTSRLKNGAKRKKTLNLQINDESKNTEKITEKQECNIADCLRDVNLLFKDEIESREKQYEKVTIKESLLLDFGEIPRTWLERYRDFTTWQDFSYQCCHCNKQIKSLNNLLKHFDEFKIPIHKRLIKCYCGKIFKDQLFLISYLNHVGKMHYTHLKFTCFFCSKVFVNVVKLSNHMDKNHGNTSLKYFPCFDCGLACSNIERLKQHKNCHEI